jgi:hypothetical protein
MKHEIVDAFESEETVTGLRKLSIEHGTKVSY